jgi:hypothetical protein
MARSAFVQTGRPCCLTCPLPFRESWTHALSAIPIQLVSGLGALACFTFDPELLPLLDDANPSYYGTPARWRL